MGVERHVEKQRSPSCRQCPRSSSESFPVRAARLVEMHVRINHAWKNVQTRRISRLAGRAAQFSLNRDDSALDNPHICGAHFGRQHYRSPSDDQIKLAHCPLSAMRQPAMPAGREEQWVARIARSPALRESASSLLALSYGGVSDQKREQAPRTLPQCGTSRGSVATMPPRAR